MAGDLRLFLMNWTVGNMQRNGKLQRVRQTLLIFLVGALLLMIPHPAAAQNLDLDYLIHSGPFDEVSMACNDSTPTDVAAPISGADVPLEFPDPQTAAPTQNPPNPSAATAAPASIGNGFP
jgi:hypothetical protein